MTRTLGPAELLALWEEGATAAPSGRAFGVLNAAGIDEPIAMTIGQRDQALLACHERWFGSSLEALTSCPACGEALDVVLSVDDLRVNVAPPGSCRVEQDGFEVDVRLPTAGDLDPPPFDVAELLDRCVLTVRHEGVDVAAADLPEPVIAAVDAALAEADPASPLVIAMSCPACGHPWQATLEPVDFVWDGVDRSARRLCDEVHVLASAYGWTEDAILALSPRRRRLYLEAVVG